MASVFDFHLMFTNISICLVTVNMRFRGIDLPVKNSHMNGAGEKENGISTRIKIKRSQTQANSQSGTIHTQAHANAQGKRLTCCIQIIFGIYKL